MKKRMQGVYVVEFAIIGLLLFILLFGVIEMGRLYFTVNALSETVRRGARLAVVCDIQEPEILRRAVFATAGAQDSSLIRNLQTSDLTLTYLDQNGQPVLVPNDLISSTGFRAIRFVQLEVKGFTFDLLIPTMGWQLTLPDFRAVLPRESLGRYDEPGVTPC